VRLPRLRRAQQPCVRDVPLSQKHHQRHKRYRAPTVSRAPWSHRIRRTTILATTAAASGLVEVRASTRRRAAARPGASVGVLMLPSYSSYSYVSPAAVCASACRSEGARRLPPGVCRRSTRPLRWMWERVAADRRPYGGRTLCCVNRTEDGVPTARRGDGYAPQAACTSEQPLQTA